MEKIDSLETTELAQVKRDAEESLAYVILGERLPLPVKKSSGEIIVAKGVQVTKAMIEEIVAAYPNIDIESGIVHRKIMDNLYMSYQKIQAIDKRSE
jgi:hypothetical protein